MNMCGVGLVRVGEAVGAEVILVQTQLPEGTDDEEILALAARQGRVLLTSNAQDFAPLTAEWFLADETILDKITEWGFSLLNEADPVQIRHRLVEMGGFSRQQPLIIITSSPLSQIPYDLWQQGQHVTLALYTFFPRLNYQVLKELGFYRGNPPGGSVYYPGIHSNLPEVPLFIEMLLIPYRKSLKPIRKTSLF